MTGVIYIHPDIEIFEHKIVIEHKIVNIVLSSILTFVLGAQKKCLNETVPWSTQNIYILLKIKKNIFLINHS